MISSSVIVNFEMFYYHLGVYYHLGSPFDVNKLHTGRC